jgi:hypothetical protein
MTEEPQVVRELKERLREAIGDGHSSDVDVEDHAQRITDTVLEKRVTNLTRQIEHHRRWRKDSHQ